MKFKPEETSQVHENEKQNRHDNKTKGVIGDGDESLNNGYVTGEITGEEKTNTSRSKMEKKNGDGKEERNQNAQQQKSTGKKTRMHGNWY